MGSIFNILGLFVLEASACSSYKYYYLAYSFKGGVQYYYYAVNYNDYDLCNLETCFQTEAVFLDNATEMLVIIQFQDGL